MIWYRGSYVAWNIVYYITVDEAIINEGCSFTIVLVGKVICCINLCDKRFSRNLLTPVGYACVNKVRLKLSVRIQFSFLYSVITLRILQTRGFS